MQELALTQNYHLPIAAELAVDLGQQLKADLLSRIQLYLPVAQAELVGGMVFGGVGQLPQDLQRSFRITGLTHVVSASGYNVSVVAGLILAIFSRVFSRSTAAILAVGVVWLYACSAMLVPPVVRAAIMITINLLGSRVFFRQYHLKFSLFLTVVIMLLLEPSYVFSLSFWLSLLATLGIILLLPLLKQSGGIFSRLATGQIGATTTQQTPNPITESLLVTVAAQSFTFPLVAVVFSEFSLLSLVANPCLLWLTPLITLLGLGLMLIGKGLSLFPGWWEQVGPVLSLLLELPAQFFLAAVAWFGQFERGLMRVNLSWWQAGLWWSVLMGLIWKKSHA